MLKYNDMTYTTDGNLVKNVSSANYISNNIYLFGKELELQTKIKSLLSKNKSLRAHGSGHSNYFDNPLYVSSNYVNLRDYTIDPVINTVASGVDQSNTDYILTASAGHELGYLRDFLKPYGLRLKGTPESKFITLGGAVAVGAHNGSDYHEIISDYVTQMLIFNAEGNVVKITDKKLITNFGTLGVIFRISIKCFPAENMYWKRTLHNSIETVNVGPTTHSLVFGPYSGKILEVELHPTTLPANKTINRYLWEALPTLLSNEYLTKVTSNVSRGLFYVFPSLGLVVSEYFLLEPTTIRDRFDYFEVAPQTNIYTLEYAVRADMFKNVYTSLMQLIAIYRELGTYVSYRFWVRFVPKSDVLNTLAYDSDVATFELTFSKDQPNAKKFANDIDLVLRSYGGIPHLGKTLISTDALSNYNFEILKKQIAQFDPEKIFENDFLKKVL